MPNHFILFVHPVVGRSISVVVMALLIFGSARLAYAADEPAENAPPQPQLQFAPIHLRPSLGGGIEYTTRRDKVGMSKSDTQVLTATVNTGVDIDTFIWQPWFAQVSGGLGLSSYMTDADYGVGASNKTVSSAITGRGALDIVPLSRFPFRADFEKSDSRQNVGFAAANSASQSTRFGLIQRYRTLSGLTNYSARYEQSRAENELSGVDRQRRAGLEMITVPSANQTLTVSATSNFNEHLGSNQSVLSDTVVANHTYRPDAAVTVDNLANLGRSNYSLAQGSTEDRYMQASSFASWFSGVRPLTITGSARLSRIDSGSSTSTNTVQQSSASANLGASYQLSKQVQTYGNAGVNLQDDQNSGVQSTSSNQSVGANYRSDMTDLGQFRYGTHASGSLSNSTASTGSTQNASVSAGHNVSRSSSDGSRVQLSTNLDQTVSVNKATLGPPSTLLAHGASLGWTIAGETGSTQVRLSASDSRAMNDARSVFQLVNLQVNRSETMTRNSSLDGNLSVQATRQEFGSESSPTVVNSSANLSYVQQRVFGIPRLNFNSDLRVYSDNLIPVVSGSQGGASRSWSNFLRYSIGQLQMSFSASVATTNGVNQSSLMFRVSRTF